MGKKILLLVPIFVLLLFTSLRFSVGATIRGATSSVPIISPEPIITPLPEASIGLIFYINITITNVINLHSYEFKLYYENIPINATSVIEQEFLKTCGSTDFEVIRLDHEYNVTHGIVWACCTLVETSTGVNGSGTLATIYFKCIDIGESGGSIIYLTDSKLKDPDGTLIPHTRVTGGVCLEALAKNQPRTFNVTCEENTFKLTTYSSSTVAKLNFSQQEKWISFYVNGISGTNGFCNITIPKVLLRENFTHPWVILIDGSESPYVKSENTTYTSLYFNYTHSTHRVQIIGAEVIPEFPAALILPLFIIITLCAIILRRRKIKP